MHLVCDRDNTIILKMYIAYNYKVLKVYYSILNSIKQYEKHGMVLNKI